MRVFALSAVALLTACATKPAPAPPPAPVNVNVPASVSPSTQALHYVDLLRAEKYDEAVAIENERMAAALPADKARILWHQLVAKLGPLKSTSVERTERAGEVTHTTVRATFEKETVGLVVGVDAHAKVTGLHLVQLETASWSPPSYAHPESFTEEEVTFGEGALALPGTLTVPKNKTGPLRAVVLVHGSGPNDRDETNNKTRTFKDLAWGLASRGIAVLRYDKVTRAHPQAWLAKYGDDITLDHETTDDAVAAIQWLKKRPEIDAKHVVVLGHSQGGLAAPRIAKSADAAGIIAFAAPARSLEDIVLAQFEYLATLPGSDLAAKLPALRESVKRVKSKDLSASTPKESLPLGLPAPYWLDLRSYRPTLAAAQLGKPILVLQGEADYKVTMDDFAIWKKDLAGKSFASFESYPSLTHSFVECGCKLGTPADDDKPAHVAPAVVDRIEGWIKS